MHLYHIMQLIGLDNCSTSNVALKMKYTLNTPKMSFNYKLNMIVKRSLKIKI